MTLECLMGDIEITPKIVKHVFGLPMGRRRLEREGQREYDDPFLLQWKDQFRNVNKLTIKALSDVIIQTKNSDYMFRMNILTLIANTLGSCENSSTVNFIVLKNVFEGDDVSDIDWCSYIIECASVSKLDWATKLKKRTLCIMGQSYLHAAMESLQPVKTLQWENILIVGSSSNTENHHLSSPFALTFSNRIPYLLNFSLSILVIQRPTSCTAFPNWNKPFLLTEKGHPMRSFVFHPAWLLKTDV
ncbi:hypothetical protein Tco_0286322 [Tanacetum coccineum]